MFHEGFDADRIIVIKVTIHLSLRAYTRPADRPGSPGGSTCPWPRPSAPSVRAGWGRQAGWRGRRTDQRIPLVKDLAQEGWPLTAPGQALEAGAEEVRLRDQCVADVPIFKA